MLSSAINENVYASIGRIVRFLSFSTQTFSPWVDYVIKVRHPALPLCTCLTQKILVLHVGSMNLWMFTRRVKGNLSWEDIHAIILTYNLQYRYKYVLHNDIKKSAPWNKVEIQGPIMNIVALTFLINTGAHSYYPGAERYIRELCVSAFILQWK